MLRFSENSKHQELLGEGVAGVQELQKDWRIGGLEDWRIGGLEDWSDGVME
jgi:hypothetical protein